MFKVIPVASVLYGSVLLKTRRFAFHEPFLR